MCKGMDDPPAEAAPVIPVFLQGIGHVIPLHSTGSWTLNEEHPAAGWTSGDKFLNWLSGHNCPESNRIVEVELLWACIQLIIDVGVLGCSRECLGLVSPGLTLLVLPAGHW